MELSKVLLSAANRNEEGELDDDDCCSCCGLLLTDGRAVQLTWAGWRITDSVLIGAEDFFLSILERQKNKVKKKNDRQGTFAYTYESSDRSRSLHTLA